MMLSKPTRLLVWSALVLTVLTACSSNDLEEELEPAPLVDFKPERSFKKVWSNSVGNGQGKIYNNLKPAIDNGMVYAAAADGTVEAISLDRGKTQWDTDLDELIVGGVGVSNALVMVGTAAGEIVVLNREDGSELWRAEVGGEVLSAPRCNGPIVFVQTFDGQVLGLDAGTGKRLWSYRNNLPVLTMRGTSSPLLFRDSLIAGFANGRVVSFDMKTGSVRWDTRIAVAKGESEIQRLVDIDGDMILGSQLLYAVSYQGKIAAIDPISGRRIWDYDASSFVGLSEGFGNVYVVEADGTITAYQEKGQGAQWAQSVLARRKLSGSATLGNYVIVGDFEGYLHAFSQVDGHLAARTRVDSDGVQADVQSADDMVIVYGNSGKLVAYRLEEKSGIFGF